MKINEMKKNETRKFFENHNISNNNSNTNTWMGTLVVSAKHIKISTEIYNVRSSSRYNFAFWHSTPGFCSFCYPWLQVSVLFSFM